MANTARLLPLLLTGLVAFAGGCSSGDPASGPAAGGTENVADDKAELAFAKCMREQGFDVSDPDGSGRTALTFKGKPGDGAMPARRVQESTTACRKKTGGGPREPSPQEQTEMRDQALKFAKCMREHGVEMPDPKFEGGGIHMTQKAGERGIDPESPAFQKAQKACEDQMPTMRRGEGPSTSRSGSGTAGGPGASDEAVVPAP